MCAWPFESTAVRNQLTSIDVEGFEAPVPGIVYDGGLLDGGMPLGGLGTGYWTLEGSGKIGHVSIYNDIVPPRVDLRDWLTLRVGSRSAPLSTADIAYFGHFPIADLVATLDQVELEIGIRAFSPFVLGDSAASNVPAALFEIEIRNLGGEAVDVRMEIAPPRPPENRPHAIAITGFMDGSQSSLFRQPPAEHAQVLSEPIRVAIGGSRRVRVSMGWYDPEWRDSSREPHVHRYGQRFVSAQEVADAALTSFDETLTRILAWQAEIYRSDYPAWVRDWLIQSLYSLAKNTVWIARTRKDEWWGENGWFTHNSTLR